MLCKHCQRVKSNRPRGLCWHCYYAPGVREQFPSTSKFARRGIRDFNGRTSLPEPTAAKSGTEAKVRVFEERARLGQALFHPLDNRDAPHASELLDPPVKAWRAKLPPLELRPCSTTYQSQRSANHDQP